MKHGGNLEGVGRCPHCGIAHPLLRQTQPSNFIVYPEGRVGRLWGVYLCSACNNLVLAQGVRRTQNDTEASQVETIYPSVMPVPSEIPEQARRFLEQAQASLSTPDGAAMLAGSAVDAMLKAKGFDDGKKSLYERIEQAAQANVLTSDMAEWAHEVRLGSNRPRHVDRDSPHVSPEEASQSVQFTTTLAQLLFVLPARIAAGKAAAIAATPVPQTDV